MVLISGLSFIYTEQWFIKVILFIVKFQVSQQVFSRPCPGELMILGLALASVAVTSLHGFLLFIPDLLGDWPESLGLLLNSS